MHPLRTFAEVWNRQEERAARAMGNDNDSDATVTINEDDAQHVESAPTISDTGQHPEVQNQPDPGATK